MTLVLASGCGKKGPPLPPLIRLPAAPAEFAAVRRGDDVDLQFTVPAANTDGSRPANIERVDAYAITMSGAIPQEWSEARIFDVAVKAGTKIGSVPVKSPRDPDETIDPDEPEEDMESPEGPGLNQGARAHVSEHLDGRAWSPLQAPSSPRTTAARPGRSPSPGASSGAAPGAWSIARSGAPLSGTVAPPLLGPSASPLLRNYVLVGVGRRGRRGPLSNRAVVPLVPPPPAPAQPTIEYSETAITVAWQPVDLRPSQPSDVLPARSIGIPSPQVAYHIYEITKGERRKEEGGPVSVETRLSTTPLAEAAFVDKRITWDVERCYVVRTVEQIGEMSLESGPSRAACEWLVDTFPPAAPRDLLSVPGEGSISLIWPPNDESDLAGYIVLRGQAPGDKLEPITPKPIQDARYTDEVPAGVRFVYAVQAVDKAGNVSPMSKREEAAAR